MMKETLPPTARLIVSFVMAAAITLCGLPDSSANSDFFKALENKSPAEQQKILQFRISFQVNHSITNNLVDFVDKYLEISPVTAEKMNFLAWSIYKAKEPALKKQVLASVNDFCGQNKRDCLTVDLQHFLICSDPSMCKTVYDFGLQMMEFQHIDLVHRHKKTFTVFLQTLGKTQSYINDAFSKAVNFGFYDVAIGLYQASPVLKNDKKMATFYCTVMLLSGDANGAESCLSQYQEPWSNVLLTWIRKSSGKPFDKKKAREVLQKLSTVDNPSGLFAIAMEILIFGNTEAQWNSTLIDRLAADYKSGYILLAVDQKLNFFSREQKNQLRQAYHRNFSNSFFSDVLDKKVPLKQLEQIFGSNNFYYLAAAG